MSRRNDALRGEAESSITDRVASIDQPSADANGSPAEPAMASFGVQRDDGIWVTECAWCERVRTVAGDWYALGPTSRASLRGILTHGICPQCARATAARADQNVEARPR